MPIDASSYFAELDWLKKNPAFEQRPATITEFLGSDYLDIETQVRPGIKKALVKIFGREVDGNVISKARRAMVTGGIGIGKTTFASLIIPYMVHWVSCLKNPQGFFNMMDGTRIAFMLMSTKETQAREVLFTDIKARIESSRWFKANCQYDTNFKNQLRFPKDIWVLPGNSAETSFEGYNILGGILDEGDSHKQTKEKDFAEAGYDTIHGRIDSRFNDPAAGDHRGLLVVIGQMKSANGFMAKKKLELEEDPRAVVVTMTIWESLGWNPRPGHPGFLNEDGTRNSFFYDQVRKQIVPKAVVEALGIDNLIEVPNAYRKNFEVNPVKALRDLAGIPPTSESAFISMHDKIIACQDRWEESHRDDMGQPYAPVAGDLARPTFHPLLRCNDSLRRAAHIDIATSGEGDALGLAIGHVPRLVETEEELKPYIVFDALIRIKARPGTEIILSEVRQLIYNLIDDRGFKIKKITLDGFQSTDSRQQFQKRKIASDYLSVDRTMGPYSDLREAIYEDRVEFPRYMTYIKYGDSEEVDIAFKELSELKEEGYKIDHPAKGSKDVADAMAGVVATLMGDRRYHRVARPASEGYSDPTDDTPKTQEFGPRRHENDLSSMLAAFGSAPIPPSFGPAPGAPGLPL